MRTKGVWYFMMVARWVVGIAAILAGRWMIALWGWPWWAAILAELLLLTLVLAFVIQWPFSYGQYVQLQNRFVREKSDGRSQDG